MDALKIAFCDDDATSLNVIAGAVASILQQQGIPAQAEKYTSPLELLPADAAGSGVPGH